MQTPVVLTGLFLLISSAIAWGLFDASRKQLGRFAGATEVAGGVCITQIPILLLFISGQTLTFDLKNYFVFGLGSIFLNVVAGYLFIRSLQLSPLSQTIPFLSFTPVFTAIAGYFFLDETLPIQGIIGIVLVVGGALVLGIKDKTFKIERGSILMIIVAMMWSLTPILDKRAIGAATSYIHTLMLAIGIAIAFGILSARKNRNIIALPNAVIKQWKWFLFAGLLNLIAVYTQFESFNYYPVSYVETLKRAIGIVLAFGIGAFLFSEKITIRDGLGAILMIFGSTFIIFAH